MRNFRLELIYESAGGETYAVPVESGFFLGMVMAAVVMMVVAAAAFTSILFIYRKVRKKKEMCQKEKLCFQSVQECHPLPSVVPAMVRPGMAEENGRVSPGETTILGGEWIPPVGTLWRRKTGEKIRIRKAVFAVGKDFQEADYLITDNPLISKCHTVFRYQYGSYYITDKDSANGTFVNEKRLTLGQEVCLKSGDRIRLADEEFEFYM